MSSSLYLWSAARFSLLALCVSVGLAQHPEAKLMGSANMCNPGMSPMAATFCIQVAVSNIGKATLQFDSLQSTYSSSGKVYRGNLVMPKAAVSIKSGESSRTFEMQAPLDAVMFANNTSITMFVILKNGTAELGRYKALLPQFSTVQDGRKVALAFTASTPKN